MDQGELEMKGTSFRIPVRRRHAVAGIQHSCNSCMTSLAAKEFFGWPGYAYVKTTPNTFGATIGDRRLRGEICTEDRILLETHDCWTQSDKARIAAEGSPEEILFQITVTNVKMEPKATPSSAERREQINAARRARRDSGKEPNKQYRHWL
jgi:hypothetical protein